MSKHEEWEHRQEESRKIPGTDELFAIIPATEAGLPDWLRAIDDGDSYRNRPTLLNVLWALKQSADRIADLERQLAEKVEEADGWRRLFNASPKHEEGIDGREFISVHNRLLGEWRTENETLRQKVSGRENLLRATPLGNQRLDTLIRSEARESPPDTEHADGVDG